MSTYAHIVSGVVAELFTPSPGFTIGDCFHADLTWVDVTVVSPQPQQGWKATLTGSTWTYSEPVSALPTLAEQAASAIVAGVTLTLSGTLTLAATLFPTDAATQIKLGGVITTLGATGAFPGGAETYPMKDASAAWHTLTPSQYKTVAGAIASYVAALDMIADGNPLGATALPAASVSLTV